MILDAPGAENLFGKGDLYLKETEKPELRRFLGFYVSNEEIQKFLEFNIKYYKKELVG